jgi:hypothetical protein
MKSLVAALFYLFLSSQTFAQLDWEDVEIANFQSEIEGLVKLGMVSSKAKGMTVYSSQGKMQTRAINKLKMFASMIGGTTILIMNQQSQSAQYGGYWGSSTSAGANISGVAFANKKVTIDQIEEGTYMPERTYFMGPNHTDIKEEIVRMKVQLHLKKEKVKETDSGLELDYYYEMQGKYSSNKWDIVKIENDKVQISSIYRTKGGKETYMTIILSKN